MTLVNIDKNLAVQNLRPDHCFNGIDKTQSLIESRSITCCYGHNNGLNMDGIDIIYRYLYFAIDENFRVNSFFFLFFFFLLPYFCDLSIFLVGKRDLQSVRMLQIFIILLSFIFVLIKVKLALVRCSNMQ